MLDLGPELRCRRRDLGLTQAQVADLAGVSERFVRDLERGKPAVQLDSLRKVLDALGVELRLAVRST